MRRGTRQGLHGQSGVKRLRVGAFVGADCLRRPGIDRYWATATVSDFVLSQHGARVVNTQRNSPNLLTDQKVGGSNPSGRALLRQTLDALEMSGAFGFSRRTCRSAPCRRVSAVSSSPLEVDAHRSRGQLRARQGRDTAESVDTDR